MSDEEVMLRTSERNLFKRCQWAWERNYVDRLSPKRESKALWFGTGIHLALEKYYIPGLERGDDPAETFRKYCEEIGADTEFINTEHDGDSSVIVSAMELGVAMLEEYVKFYGPEPHLEVIATELSFNVGVKYRSWRKLPLPDLQGEYATLKPDKAQYVGQIDLVVRDTRTNKIWMWDHKTTSQLGSSNTQYLPLDDQAGSYWTMATAILRDKGLIGPRESISGIVYNYLVKKMPSTKPRNAQGLVCNLPTKQSYIDALVEAGVEEAGLAKLSKKDLEDLASDKEIEVFGEPSAKQPTPMFDRKIVYRRAEERKTQVQRIQLDLQAMSLVRNKVVPPSKTPTRECSFCPFKEICELDEAKRDWSEMADFSYTKWDPYENYRESEDG